MQVFEYHCQKPEHEYDFLFIGLKTLELRKSVPRALSQFLLMIQRSNMSKVKKEYEQRRIPRDDIPNDALPIIPNHGQLFDLSILKMHDKCHLGCYDC
jgi:hypothetical protein